jgi:hypothetical protein
MSALSRLDRSGNSRSSSLRPTGWLMVSLWSGETLLREQNLRSDIYCICRLLVSSANELKRLSSVAIRIVYDSMVSETTTGILGRA